MCRRERDWEECNKYFCILRAASAIDITAIRDKLGFLSFSRLFWYQQGLIYIVCEDNEKHNKVIKVSG